MSGSGRPRRFNPELLLGERIWWKRDRLRYSEIYEIAKKQYPILNDISKRTFKRYIRYLRKKKKLDRIIDGEIGIVYYVRVKKEIARDRSLDDIRNMPIDFIVDYEKPFLLSSALEREEPHRLNYLNWLDTTLQVEGESALPTGEMRYSFFHWVGRKAPRDIQEWLKMKFHYQLNKLVAEILSEVVMLVDNKDPRFIENLDELIDWYRDALNQKVVVQVQFDGKSIAEKTDWDQLKRKIRGAKRRRDTEIKNAIKKGVKRGQKLREELDPEEIKEYLNTFYSKLAESNLKTIISRIMNSLPEYKSPEAATLAVIKTLKDEEKVGEIARYESQFLPEHVEPDEAVKRYLEDPESEYILQQRKYTYPGTNRTYVLYEFVSRDLAEALKGNNGVPSN